MFDRAFTWFHQFILSLWILSYRIASSFSFSFSLFLSLTFIQFSILSPLVVAPFFLLRHFFPHGHSSCCLLSPFGSFHPRFPRRLIFFVIVSLFSSSLSLPLSLSFQLLYNSFLRGLLFHAPSSLLPIRFILPTRVFPFWLSGSLPRSLVALVYHSWLSYREIRWHAFTLCARDITSVSFH